MLSRCSQKWPRFFLQYAVQSLSEQQLMAYTPPRARRPNFMLVNEQDVKKRFPSFPFFQLKKNLVKFTQGSRKFKFTLFWSTFNVQSSPKQVQFRCSLGPVKVQVQVQIRSIFRSILGQFKVHFWSTFGPFIIFKVLSRCSLGLFKVHFRSNLGLVQVQYSSSQGPLQVHFQAQLRSS